MRACLTISCLSLGMAWPQTADSSSLSSAERLNAFKARTGLLLENTRDYACLETISRLSLMPGQKGVRDVVRVEVGVANQKEMYGWQRSDRFSSQQLPEMIHTGMTTTGLYGAFAQGLMTMGNGHFTPAGEEKIYGEPAFRYDFNIPLKDGVWNLRNGDRTGKAGQQGSLWVDEKSMIVRRVEASPDEIPPQLRLKHVRMVIDYELSAISGTQMLLPSVARMAVVESNGALNLSHIFFTHCRSYGSESTVSFGPAPAAGAKAPPSMTELPEGLEVSAQLKSAVDLKSAQAGDLVEAVISKRVVSKGKEIVADGALLEGKIRQVRLLDGKYAATVEFDRVQSAEGWAQFYARMKDLRGLPGHVTFDAKPDVSEGQELTDPEIPGVTTIYFPEGRTTIAAGTVMKWKTEGLAPEREDAAKTVTTPTLSTGMHVN